MIIIEFCCCAMNEMEAGILLRRFRHVDEELFYGHLMQYHRKRTTGSTYGLQ